MLSRLKLSNIENEIWELVWKEVYFKFFSFCDSLHYRVDFQLDNTLYIKIKNEIENKIKIFNNINFI